MSKTKTEYTIPINNMRNLLTVVGIDPKNLVFVRKAFTISNNAVNLFSVSNGSLSSQKGCESCHRNGTSPEVV